MSFLTWYILGIGKLANTNLIIEEPNICYIIMISDIFVIGFVVGKWEQRAFLRKTER
jgi:hypothetical protein